MPNKPKVEWEQIKRCLAALRRESGVFLGQALLIGGAACWFYRIQLRRAADPDFVVPELSSATEALWLSKDIDFTGVFSGDALAMLPHCVVTDEHGRKHLAVEGVRLGFAQVGLTLDPEEALRDAVIGSFDYEGSRVEFLVADAVTLYREKQALVQRRNQASDQLHFALLSEYVAWRVTIAAEQYLRARAQLPMVEQQQMEKLFLAVGSKAPEVFADPRIDRRLRPLLRDKDPASRVIVQRLHLR